jgi:hypothetical protein
MLKWKRGGFVVAGDVMTQRMFDAWVETDGRSALRDAWKRTPNPWFFGRRRARRRLSREAQKAFASRGTFAGMLKKQLDQLPLLVRSCAIIVRRSGYSTLNTTDGNRGICTVPRGVVLNDFKVQLARELLKLPQVRGFDGLTERVLAAAAADAETALFAWVVKGNPVVDATGRGLVIAADADFRWKISGMDGHYYYAYSTEEKIDLAARKECKRFISQIQESLKGQSVYLKRLSGGEVADIAEALQLRRILEAGTESTGARVRSRLSRDPGSEMVLDVR